MFGNNKHEIDEYCAEDNNPVMGKKKRSICNKTKQKQA